MENLPSEIVEAIVRLNGPYTNKKLNKLKTNVGSLHTNIHARLEYKYYLVSMKRVNKQLYDIVNKTKFIYSLPFNFRLI